MADDDGFDLDSISVAKPCPADWAAMKGDDRVRACALCRKNVYNLSNLTRAEAVSLVQRSRALVEAGAPTLCIRFFRRADGTVLTQDCPVGLAKWRRRVTLLVTGVMASFTLALTVIVGVRARALWFSDPRRRPLKPSRSLPPPPGDWDTGAM